MTSQAKRVDVAVTIHAYGDVWESVALNLRRVRVEERIGKLLVEVSHPELRNGLAVARVAPHRINIVACDQIHVVEGREGLLGRDVRSIGITSSKAVAYALLATQWEGVVLDQPRVAAWKYIEAAWSLWDIIDAVSQGATWVSPAVRAPLEDPRIRSLTRREWSIAILLADGFSATRIAEAMSLSPKTIECHRRNIYVKIGAHGVIDLRKCMEQVGFAIAPAGVRRALREEAHAIMAPEKDPLPGDLIGQCGE